MWLQSRSPLVTVDALNESSRQVESLELISDNGIITKITNLEPGKRQTFKMYSSGEAAFRVRAELSGGSIFDDSVGYVESGYKIRVTVGDKGIQTVCELR